MAAGSLLEIQIPARFFLGDLRLAKYVPQLRARNMWIAWKTKISLLPVLGVVVVHMANNICIVECAFPSNVDKNSKSKCKKITWLQFVNSNSRTDSTHCFPALLDHVKSTRTPQVDRMIIDAFSSWRARGRPQGSATS